MAAARPHGSSLPRGSRRVCTGGSRVTHPGRCSGLCVAFVSHARLLFLRHPADSVSFQPYLLNFFISFTEQSGTVHLGVPRAYFSSCHMAFLKLAADATGHKDVTSACVLVTEGHRNLGCLNPNRTPFPVSRSLNPPPAFCTF